MKSFFTNLKQRYNIRDYKISLVFLVTLISLVGILMVRSARPDLMNRQIMGVCLGLIVMFIISFIDYKWILNLYWPLYALNIVMLLAVLVFGTKVNGARRWLNLGFTQFQPSDLTKILMILFFAKLWKPTRTSGSCCFPSKRLSMCLWKRERTSRLRCVPVVPFLWRGWQKEKPKPVRMRFPVHPDRAGLSF